RERAINHVLQAIEPGLRLLDIVEIVTKQVELTRDRGQGLDGIVMELAGEAIAFLGDRQVANPGRQPCVLDSCCNSAREGLEKFDIVRAKGVRSIALDIENADQPPADSKWNRACT